MVRFAARIARICFAAAFLPPAFFTLAAQLLLPRKLAAAFSNSCSFMP